MLDKPAWPNDCCAAVNLFRVEGLHMRIICWNMQKLELEDHGMSRTIAGLIDQWNAEVVIMLEPPSGLCHEGDRAISSGRGGTVWTVKTFTQGSGDNHAKREGRAAVASHPGVTVERLAALNPYDHPNYARQLLILSFTKGAERVRVATCHAPFDEGGVAIVEYVRLGAAALRNWMQHHGPIDVWLGDVNTAGVHSPDPVVWVVRCARPTTDKGRATPRDKIFVRSGALAGAACGRIVSVERSRAVMSAEKSPAAVFVESSSKSSPILLPSTSRFLASHGVKSVASPAQSSRNETA